jgi:putative transposase
MLPEDRDLIRQLVASGELVHLAPRELSFKALEEHKQYISHVAIWDYMRARGIYDVARSKRRRRARNAEPPDTSFATERNQLWAWDISHLRSFVPHVFFYLYLIEDWVSRKAIAWHVSESLASSEVPKVWDQAIVAEGLIESPRCLWPVALSDRGPQMRSRATRRYLGLVDIEQLFARPKTPNDNPRVEALFATVKMDPRFPGRYATCAAALAWCDDYFTWYNNEHHHRALDFVTPAQRHSGEHIRILEERRRLKQECMARRRQFNEARA